MNVDLDAIAQRGRCEVSSLRLALPLIEQGYTPPFLARYRRDELGGLDESSLWALSHAVRTQQRLETYREELHAAWQATPLADPALGRAISNAKSRRLLDRLSRRVKLESGESANLAQRLAVRLLSPEKGDGDDLEGIGVSLLKSGAAASSKSTSPAAASDAEAAAAPAATEDPAGATEQTAGAEDSPASASATSPVSAAIDKLDDALAKRLSGDPRIMGAAVRWLSRQAKIHILEVSDPHGHEDGDGGSEAAVKPSKAAKKKKKRKSAEPAVASAEATPADAANAQPPATEPAAAATTPAQPSEASAPAETASAAKPLAATEGDAAAAESTPATESAPVAESAPATEDAATAATPAPTAESDSAPVAAEAPAEEGTPPVTAETPVAETPAVESPVAETPATETPATDAQATDTQATETPVSAAGDEAGAATPKPAAAADAPATKTEKKASAAAKPAKKKKISPRQRRRRWLVSTLKPLAGKRMPAAKLSAFQVVMLGRALRSQVAQCAFDYDAAQLVAEMQKAASNINRTFGDRLASIVLGNEAALREAAESAWWDEIQEQASARLVTIAADHLHRQINRGGVDAKVVMSIDAIGPRTAATSIVAADGRVLHNEDIPCQLSAAMRTLAVTKMGELIHQYQVDLIVISNGPARRACMIAVGELIKQSAEKSVRWTLADRSGADAYAGSAAGDQEMKSTPRRFRSAAWVAFATLQPSQAMVKVDPLKLRLGSFQRELSDQAVLDAVEDVLVSGASRGGVDVNSTTASWLERLPGMTRQTAEKIEAERRESLIASRDDLLARADWASPIHTRQALPFLRVFNSEETLDGTLIHPDDYPIAKRLAKSLELELPPSAPPGYEPPDYSDPKPEPVVEVVDGAAVESVPKELPADESKAFGPIDESSATEDTASMSEQPAAAEPASEPEAAAETPEPEAASPEAASPEASSDDAAAADEPATDEPATESPVAEDDSTTTADDSAAGEPVAEDANDESAAAETADAAPPTAPVVPEPFRQQKPERAQVEKLIKEWQLGTQRSLQIVSWLCEPFGDGVNSGPAPAVMNRMPALADLKEGDEVIGVVVGVMPFGVFVELTPECSGLIHVSRVSDGFVEDLHEAVQVGDVVTAWVTGIDTKRRRVGLSAVSPEREAELQARRHDSRGPRRDGRGGAGRGPRRGAAATEGARDAGRAAGGGRSPQGAAAGGRSPGAAAGGGPRRDGRGGTGRGRPGGGGGRRDQQRGGGRGPRRPEVYEVVGKEPDSAPLSDAMQEGKEPLRSFGDLMQLFNKDKPKPAEKSKPAQPKAEQPKAEQPKAEGETKPADETSPQVVAESAPAAAAAPEAPQVASGNDTESDQSTTS